MPNFGFLITRQDRFHFYVALIFIILTVVCIKKIKANESEIVSYLVYIYFLSQEKIRLIRSKEVLNSMDRITANPVQKWKLIMYISIFTVILMNFAISANDTYLYRYLQSLTSNYTQEKILFGSIYYVYLFFHLLIIIGAKKSNSRVIYIVLIYWILEMVWIFASLFTWFSFWDPLLRFRVSKIGQCLWILNTSYFTNSDENFIRTPIGIVIFRQTRIRFYNAVIYLVITALSIKKRKKTDV